MTFSLTFAQTFMNELIGVPQNVAKRVSKATKLLERDPISAEGDAKKLKGYENVYRIRIGDYRLFYAIGTGWVKLLSVRKRNERTYETEIPNVVAPETTLDRQSVKPKKIPSSPSPLSQNPTSYANSLPSPPSSLSQNPTSYANSLPSPPSPLSLFGRGGTGKEENLAPLSPLGSYRVHTSHKT